MWLKSKWLLFLLALPSSAADHGVLAPPRCPWNQLQLAPPRRPAQTMSRPTYRALAPKPGDFPSRLSDKLAQNDPGIDLIFKHYSDLVEGNRLFDNQSDLREMRRRIAEGKPSPALAADPANWATHGVNHVIDIAVRASETVDDLANTGRLEGVSRADLAILKELGAVLAMTHDMGMFSTAPDVRDRHWRYAGKLAAGYEEKGLETVSSGLNKFFDDLYDNPNSRLGKLLKQIAADPELPYAGNERERFRTLAAEMVMGSLSHGRGENFQPALGLASLGSRRNDYLKILKQPMPGVEPSQVWNNDALSFRYRDGNVDRHFMAWTSNPRYQRLAKVFSLGEQVLNIADANRTRGLGRLTASGGTQIVAVPGEPESYAVKTDRDTGQKLLVALGPRQWAGTNVETGQFKADGSFEVKVREATFSSPQSDKVAGKETGRLIGDLLGSIAWASHSDIKHSKHFVLDVPKGNQDFQKELDSALRKQLEASLMTNGIPTDGVKIEYRFRDASLKEKPAPSAIEAARRAGFNNLGQPLTPRRTAELIVGLARTGANVMPGERNIRGVGKIAFTPDKYLEGAREVKMRKGEILVEEGKAREFVYLLVDGAAEFESLGGKTKGPVDNPPEAPAILGASAFLGSEHTPRNASVRITSDEARVIVIPKETAEKYWRHETLATAAEQVEPKIRRMYNDQIPRPQNPPFSLPEVREFSRDLEAHPEDLIFLYHWADPEKVERFHQQAGLSDKQAAQMLQWSPNGKLTPDQVSTLSTGYLDGTRTWVNPSGKTRADQAGPGDYVSGDIFDASVYGDTLRILVMKKGNTPTNRLLESGKKSDIARKVEDALTTDPHDLIQNRRTSIPDKEKQLPLTFAFAQDKGLQWQVIPRLPTPQETAQGTRLFAPGLNGVVAQAIWKKETQGDPVRTIDFLYNVAQRLDPPLTAKVISESFGTKMPNPKIDPLKGGTRELFKTFLSDPRFGAGALGQREIHQAGLSSKPYPSAIGPDLSLKQKLRAIQAVLESVQN